MHTSELSTSARAPLGSASLPGETTPSAPPLLLTPPLPPRSPLSRGLITGPPLPSAAALELPEPLFAFADTTRALADRLAALLPDGHGVTVQLAGEMSPRAFRSGAEAQRFIAALPPR